MVSRNKLLNDPYIQQVLRVPKKKKKNQMKRTPGILCFVTLSCWLQTSSSELLPTSKDSRIFFFIKMKLTLSFAYAQRFHVFQAPYFIPLS